MTLPRIPIGRSLIARRYSHSVALIKPVASTGNSSAPISSTFLSPRSLVEYLDGFIIGQFDAKRSLAIAITDRQRRMRVLDEELRRAIIPSNILLLGPTGSGKTEVARRLARKVEAPFVKVVATKYSEVGFVGDDTSSMIEELAEQALVDETAALRSEVLDQARHLAEQEVVSCYMMTPTALQANIDRLSALSMISSGLANDIEIDIDSSFLDYSVSRPESVSTTVSYANDDPTDLPTSPSRTILSSRSSPRLSSIPRPVMRKITVSQALKKMTDRGVVLLAKAREHELKDRAKRAVEEKGIVFIDEFDKMVSDAGEEGSSFNQKRRGVEKELLSLIEGTIVQTKKLGPISTDHVVFICAGAFSCVSPKQIMPELQGRLPIRCKMKALTEEDFVNILKNVHHPLPVVQRELMLVDSVDVRFTECGIREIAKVAVEMNKELVNTGARRLNTVVGLVMENLKYAAEEMAGEVVEITAEYVRGRVGDVKVKPEDLRRFIL